jgi:hypothetical protein
MPQGAGKATTRETYLIPAFHTNTWERIHPLTGMWLLGLG